jgi:hypothetical protein
MSARVVASLAIATRMDQCMRFASSTAAWGNAARRRPRGTARTRAAPLRHKEQLAARHAGRTSKAKGGSRCHAARAEPSAGDRQDDALARAGVDLVVRVGDAVKR